MINNTKNDNNNNNGGVKGFLLLLSFFLTFVLPAYRTYALVKNLREEVGYPSFHNLGEKLLVFFDSSLVILLIVFSIYAGVSLWTRKANAVRIAKLFMLSCIAYSALTLFYPLLGLFNTYTNLMFSFFLFIDFLCTVLIFGSLYLYLCKSRRVRETYSIL